MNTKLESITFNVPKEDEAGFVAFLDDAMQIAALQDNLTPQGWVTMRDFLIRCIDLPEEEARVLFRSFSLPQLMATFEALMQAVSSSKKN